MAKSIILSALTKVLGDFVEGLDEDHLRVGLWSGEIDLQNLKLDTKRLQQLDLSVNVQFGVVEHLNVKIPWSSIASEPIRVSISGVYLLVGPQEGGIDPKVKHIRS